MATELLTHAEFTLFFQPPILSIFSSVKKQESKHHTSIFLLMLLCLYEPDFYM